MLGGLWVSLREHVEALRAADDRRYAEVALEREKALLLLTREREVALDLARDIQTYKDQQHNGLLAQISDERGTYVTQAELRALTDKMEALIKPLSEFAAAARGSIGSANALWGYLLGAVGVGLAIVAFVTR